MKKLESLVPPGENGKSERWMFHWLWGLSAVEFMARFLMLLTGMLHLANVYRDEPGMEVQIPTFSELARDAVHWGILPLFFASFNLLLAIVLVLVHYRVFRGNSHPDFALRRLPYGHARHLLCWAIPLYGILGLLLALLAAALVCLAVYFLATPGYLRPGLW